MILKKTLIFIVVTLFSLQLSATDVPDGIIQSFKKGDAALLAGFFNQNIELVVLEHDDVYSKAQAQQIVANFFSKNKVVEFKVIHNSKKEGVCYAVYSLKTENSSFRVSFLLKNSGNKVYIHQLRIAKP